MSDLGGLEPIKICSFRFVLAPSPSLSLSLHRFSCDGVLEASFASRLGPSLPLLAPSQPFPEMADGAQTLQVAVPEGVVEGGTFVVTTPDNQAITLTCPPGCAAGSPISFSYVPSDGVQLSARNTQPVGFEEHPDDVVRMQQAMELAMQQQEQLIQAGAVPATLPPAGEFQGHVFAPAMFAVGMNAIVTRSDGSESGCNIYEVFLTALGPQYNVFLGVDAAGENIFKWCSESDLRAYPTEG